jgi:hypothetical protein
VRVEDLPPEIAGHTKAVAVAAAVASEEAKAGNGKSRAADEAAHHPWSLSPAKASRSMSSRRASPSRRSSGRARTRRRAGKLFGINRDQVRYRLEKYGLRKESEEK